jgi:diguanylate cyclase (GGDEF)-like protein
MNLLMPRKKPTTESVTANGLEAEIARLARQNATLKREVAKLQVFRSMAYRDPLTGLWNRRFFEERLREEASRSKRAGADRRFSVAIVDINGFKEINDDHGHQAGDVMLKWVGEFLTKHLRTHDVPCRTGGDEFMILLPDLSAADCQLVISRLRQQLTDANVGRELPVSLSIGTSSWPEISESCEKLLDAADGAMYDDKRRQKAARGEVPRTTPMSRTGRMRIANIG